MANSCRLCWSCTNQCFLLCCFLSFLSLPIILTVDKIVQVNMHSFLPCFSNMHSALIQENDTFHKSHWLFLVWGGKRTLTAVTHLHCLVVGMFYVLPMERPAFAFSSFLPGGLQPNWLSVGLLGTSLQSSGVGLFFFFFTALLFAMPSQLQFSVQAQQKLLWNDMK